MYESGNKIEQKFTTNEEGEIEVANDEDSIKEKADTNYLKYIGKFNSRTRYLEEAPANGDDSVLERATVIESIYKHNNENNNSLSARELNTIAEDLNLPLEEVFPKDGLILNIGDPWQAMGKYPNVVTEDYKYGDVALFNPNPDYTIKYDDQKVTAMITSVKELIGDAKSKVGYNDSKLDSKARLEQLDNFTELYELFIQLGNKLKDANESAKKIEYFGDAKRIESLWASIREKLDELFKKLNEEPENEDGHADAIRSTVRFMWYNCVEIQRQLNDLIDWNFEIVPKVKKKEMEMKREGYSQDDLDNLLPNFIKSEIEVLRLKKRHEHGKVVTAVFPELPFADGTFDRFVAPWSISTESIPHADEEEMVTYWKEIERVLKPGGKAYIYPLTWTAFDRDKMIDSIHSSTELTASIEQGKNQDIYLYIEKPE